MDERPVFFDILSPGEKYEYLELKKRLQSTGKRNRRNKKNESFLETLGTIKRFVVVDGVTNWKRALVCGIAWFPKGLGINTRQLKLLIKKCKSSINGTLHMLGYSISNSSELLDYFPPLSNNFAETRQWTYRAYNPKTPPKEEPKKETAYLPPPLPPPPPELTMNFAPKTPSFPYDIPSVTVFEDTDCYPPPGDLFYDPPSPRDYDPMFRSFEFRSV